MSQPGHRPGHRRRRGAAARRRFLERAPLRIAVFVICFLWFLPTLGLLVTSVRDPQDITQTGWWTALLNPFDLSQWTLQNYANVLTADGMAQAFVNSLIVAIPATVIPITVAAFAAYAFAWMRFPFRITLFIIVVGLLVVPLQMALIPVLQVYSATGIAGTFLGVWLAHTGFGLPLAVFLLYNFISQLPEDLFETAAIDGATHFQMFTRIVLPLSVPALAAFAIFQFMWVWNDLLVALVFLGPQDNVGRGHGQAHAAGGQPRRAVARPHGGRLRHHDPAAARLPGPAALLHPRHPGRLRQGLSVAPARPRRQRTPSSGSCCRPSRARAAGLAAAPGRGGPGPRRDALPARQRARRRRSWPAWPGSSTAPRPDGLPLLIGADQEGGQLVGLGHEHDALPGRHGPGRGR